MYVYILKSQVNPTHHYTGLTRNLKHRLHAHHDGKSTHTAKYRPWIVKNVFWFDSKEKAQAFEKYLKSGSGRAFSKKHF